MPQLTIYLDKEAEKRISRAARRESMSLSRWAREKLVLAAGAPAWPKGYEQLLGKLDDPTFTTPPEAEGILDTPADFSPR